MALSPSRKTPVLSGEFRNGRGERMRKGVRGAGDSFSGDAEQDGEEGDSGGAGERRTPV